jgi:hypothetical protein
VQRPDGKGSLGRHRFRLENNIKWIFKKWGEAYSRLIWFGIGAGEVLASHGQQNVMSIVIAMVT